ncbi:sporulation membrane protein YtaF [Paenibacillus protaetiae]|uniref:sporulation membrane protein YtaF n=1 Tax=Paenibacillus protaetiae TaxID=2509456 RepID=UPI001ABE179F|nr:sporulation membrane protein YtaF [Paenibacillus protaetiae]
MLAHTTSLLLLAFAVSIDGFGVGITYGLRRIRIPLLSVFIIACCSGIIIWLSMQAGTYISGFLSPVAAKDIGACLLFVIGGWALIQSIRRKQSGKDAEDDLPVETRAAERAAHPVLVMMVELKRLGLVIQILRTPQAADVDRSGTISASEALMLGFALSLDAFGAGFGAAMLGLPPFITALAIAAASAFFLLGGMGFGFHFSKWKGMQALSLLPGIMLIIIGMLKLLN